MREEMQSTYAVKDIIILFFQPQKSLLLSPQTKLHFSLNRAIQMINIVTNNGFTPGLLCTPVSPTLFNREYSTSSCVPSAVGRTLAPKRIFGAN